MKKSKKISKVKKIVRVSKIINNNKEKENIIPEEYKKLYNSLLYKIRRHVYKKPFSTIKFEISKLENDDEDSFFPYKCYIYLNNNDNKMKFEIFLSTIICKYTIRSIDISNNTEMNRSFSEDSLLFSGVSMKENINDNLLIKNNKNIISDPFSFLQDIEKKIYQQIKGYNKIEGIIGEILSQYKIIFINEIK